MDIDKSKLKESDPELFKIAFEKGTEAPFSGKLLNEKGDGVYRCRVCGNELFNSDAKFDSGTGWPSFDEAIPGSIKEINDDSYGMSRIETVCSKCGAHLGHVFDDGPTDTGKRYCMNSVCLGFEEGDK
jgi:peptide-methionine (R)-S-oxide reductase